MTTYVINKGPSRRWAEVNTGSDVKFSEAPQALRADGAGTIVLTGSDGVDVPFAVAAGETLSVMPAGIKSVGTTATGIKALY